jgi:hypothetical protein
VQKQTGETKAKADKMKAIVCDETITNAAKTIVEVLTPVVKLLRITDTKAGSTLGKVYACMLRLDEYFREAIKGLDEEVPIPAAPSHHLHGAGSTFTSRS